MRVVVDANILAAALVRPKGWTATHLARDDVSFLVPAYLVEELAGHEQDLARKAGCTLGQWRARVDRMLRRTTIVDAASMRRFQRHPLVLAVNQVDADDGVYVAALLASDADFLWTRDKDLASIMGASAGPVLPEGDADDRA